MQYFAKGATAESTDEASQVTTPWGGGDNTSSSLVLLSFVSSFSFLFFRSTECILLVLIHVCCLEMSDTPQLDIYTEVCTENPEH